jgi:hypothetical protein
MRPHLVLGHVRQAEPGQRRVEDQGGVVEPELPVDVHPQFAPNRHRSHSAIGCVIPDRTEMAAS